MIELNVLIQGLTLHTILGYCIEFYSLIQLVIKHNHAEAAGKQLLLLS